MKLKSTYVKFKLCKDEKMRFLLVLLVGISIVSCTNDLDEMLGTQNLQTRSVEPRFTGNISESQAIALMNKFLDAPSFFYLKMHRLRSDNIYFHRKFHCQQKWENYTCTFYSSWCNRKERKIWSLWNSSNEQRILFIEKWDGFAWRTYL